MRLKLMSLVLATVIALVGCQANTDNQEGRTNDRGTNVEQTRYNNNDDGRMNKTEDRRGNVGTRDRNDQGDGYRDNRDNRGFGDNRGDREKRKNNERYDVTEKDAVKMSDKV